MLNQNGGTSQEVALEALRQKAVDFAIRASRERVQKAKSEIALLRGSEDKEALIALAEFALERKA
jgi:geranylgeranyl pyrophosphate synthase